ncbi:class II aldolase/adducin N-terminal [Amylocarpus encephaloides]|uniref:Class II aldolase/adducin N-terminal n=1 Tax=Amylocarpus encephaloides TaxID=45428 RepID=A0A9P8C753_9HELO|nr:class II aldolase/adducin N-terminal [Amylocarpus encephaloides]
MSPPSADGALASSPSVEVKSRENRASMDQAAAAKMAAAIAGPTFTDPLKEREYQKGRLTLAFRIFAKFGFDEGVAGHITLRDPVEPTSFWVNPFGVAWSLLKSSDLIRVDHTGEVVDGGPVRLLNTAAFNIHHAVHSARPEINCVAHSHSIYGRSFSTLGRPLDTITQDSCAFHNDLAHYATFGGIVLEAQEGQDIANALGSNKAALLQNHGLLTCAKTIEAAIFWFMSLEKCCHAQLIADAAAAGRGGTTVKIGEEEAAYTYKTVGTELAGWFGAKPTFDVMTHEAGEGYLL